MLIPTWFKLYDSLIVYIIVIDLLVFSECCIDPYRIEFDLQKKEMLLSKGLICLVKKFNMIDERFNLGSQLYY